MTVRNERHDLRRNILYHRLMGVDTFFVYDDGSTDGTLESVADLDFVVARQSAQPDETPAWPDLATAIKLRETHVGARQVLNTAHAMEIARRGGIAWLIGFDPDELLVIDRLQVVPNSVATALEQLPADVAAAVFRPLEAVQRRIAYDNVMAEETLFKIAGAGARRMTFDPIGKREVSIRAVYGHRKGKSAVRLTADAIPANAHQFLAPGGKPLESRRVGDLLHYFAPDLAAFVRKFRVNRELPDVRMSGRDVSPQKRIWRDVVNHAGLDAAELRDYYREWVMFDENELKKLKGRRTLFIRRRRALVEVQSARDAMLMLAQQSGSES